MGNITLTGPSDKIKQARILAAQRETSVSTLFFDYIDSLTATGTLDDAALWERERSLMDQGLYSIGTIAWTRDDLHDRAS